MINQLARLLREGNHSLVVRTSDGRVLTYDGPGVSDLVRLIDEDPDVLRKALVADKVVGRAAASLMVWAGVCEVYGDVMSEAALCFLTDAGIHNTHKSLVQYIANRSGDGMCPLDKRCQHLTTPEACLPEIRAFIAEMKAKNA